MFLIGRCACIVVGVVTAGVAAPVWGAPCPADPSVGYDARASDGDPDERLAYLQERLDASARAGQAWAGTFGASYALAAAAQFSAAALVDDRGLRSDFYVGGTAAAIGALVRILLRPAAIQERRKLKRALSETHDPCARVQLAERALVHSADWERRKRAVVQHLIPLGFTAVTAVILGVAFDRPVSANRQAVLGGVVGQIMVLTAPRTASRALARYRSGAASGVVAQPMLLPRGAGVAFSGRF